mmetsp:Transcript_11206/g.21081  ORF Transcript_11206/g.21081 Transcript_11206/m.21081 type:complete len:114 (+) Transcript_11206:88-429(+)
MRGTTKSHPMMDIVATSWIRGFFKMGARWTRRTNMWTLKNRHQQLRVLQLMRQPTLLALGCCSSSKRSKDTRAQQQQSDGDGFVDMSCTGKPLHRLFELEQRPALLTANILSS